MNPHRPARGPLWSWGGTSLLLACLLTPGCGSTSSSASSSLGSAPASTPASSSLAGSWRGTLSNGGELQVYLTQSGAQLRGDGALFNGGDPLPVQVGGSVGTGGVAELALTTVDKSLSPYVGSLEMEASGNQAQATLSDDQGGQDLSLTRTTLASLSLPGSLQVSSSQAGLSFQVSLDTAGTYDYQGTWSITSGPPLVCVQSFSQGRVSYTPTGQSDWARLAFEDPSGILELGTLWVRTGSQIDPDSTALTAQGLLHLGN